MVQVAEALAGETGKKQDVPHNVLPHNFRTLRGEGGVAVRPSLLVIGSGLSYQLVPPPGALLAAKRDQAEHKLGVIGRLAVNENPLPRELYEWAQDMIRQLAERGDPNPKLSLAKALGIPHDECWHVCAVPRTSTPRHRVIARFAREELWDQIWSLNWDCAQESAFEQVGLKRDGVDRQLPWPTRFLSFVTAADCQGMGERFTVKIAKPHGCASALLAADKAALSGAVQESVRLSQRFLIGADELARLPDPLMNGATQQFVFASLVAKLASAPLVIAGWSASEQYLLDHMDEKVRKILQEISLADDELSVIDVAFNAEGHARLAGFYGRDAASAHIRVQPQGFTTDDLFLWLQAFYALGRMEAYVSGAPIEQIVEDDRREIRAALKELEQPNTASSSLVDWVDSFLTAWTRLCWRCGLVECYNRAEARVQPSDVPLESAHEHVPWRAMHIRRPDMIAAARLLAAVRRGKSGVVWDFAKYPGALHSEGQLVIPLPAEDRSGVNDLRGIKPLIDALQERGIAAIERVHVVPLAFSSADVVRSEMELALKEVLARELSAVRFRSHKIGSMRLEDL